MSRRVQLIRVFLASPGDVAEERIAAERVVAELNRVVAASLGLHLHLIKYETDVAPSFGADAQDVINGQVRDDYDIFVGLLFKRFGTPTLRADSGTAEEFQRAYTRFEANKRSVRVLFYFKKKEFSPTADDLESLSKIFNFKKELGKLGGLYWEYVETTEFEAFLRLHLAHHIHEWGKTWGDAATEATADKTSAPVQVTASRVISPETLVASDDVGLIELAEGVSTNLTNALASTVRIGSHFEKMGEKLEELAAEVSSKNLSNSTGPTEAREFADRAAAAISEFARSIDDDIPTFSANYSLVYDVISKTLGVIADFGENGQHVRAKMITDLRDNLSAVTAARGILRQATNTIIGIPRLNGAITSAKRHAASALERLEGEFRAIESALSQILQSVEME